MWQLNLDRVESLFPFLGLNSPKDLGSQIKAASQGWQENSFNIDPRPPVYRFLQRLETLYGPDAVVDVGIWENKIYMRGADGDEEYEWERIAVEIHLQGDERGFEPELIQAVNAFSGDTTATKPLQNRNLQKWLAIPFSPKDEAALALNETTSEEVLIHLELICKRVAFLRAWRIEITAQGSDFLERLFLRGVALVSEQTAVSYLFHPDILPFPSSWEMGLERILFDFSQS